MPWNNTCCILLFLADTICTQKIGTLCVVHRTFCILTAAVVWVVYYSNSHCFEAVARNVMTWPWLPLHLSLSLVHNPNWENRSLWFIQILYHIALPKENVPAICICRSVGLLLSWKRILSSIYRCMFLFSQTQHLMTSAPVLMKLPELFKHVYLKNIKVCCSEQQLATCPTLVW